MEKIPSSILPYLEEIAQCLWSKNASIMIGAGFSMNSKPVFENAKRFPLWQDLGNAFYKKVRGEEIQDATYNFFDPLKLAYEVESNFGRPVLDSMLRTHIPDNEYKPSDLHQSLLRLPWTDVFTTNYDTLLERAADTVSERNYKVVVHKDNLVHSVPPRIVKLHGCFSASTPLIISEEDYRTYPQRYAPFVNTVQQTLLENTLCLIGFSGDDPNFLKWIGWIRDNLGAQNAPKIYLIGVLNLSSSQEKALAQYNITCVDMSVCQDVGRDDHQEGISKFINYCETRKQDESQKSWDLSSKLSYSKLNSKDNKDTGKVVDELKVLVSIWNAERCSYPNWLVTPNSIRSKLWSSTQNWSSIFNKDISLPEQLLKDFVYEFLWRKEKSLIPLFDNEIKLIIVSIQSDLDNPEKMVEQSQYVILALLRYYREEGKSDEWKSLFDNVEKRTKADRFNDSLIYEKALHLLFDNEFVELLKLLSTWEAGNTSALWMYRKAGLLAELNKLTDAKEILEKALIKTRRKINTVHSVSDYANVSLESYILVLLNNVTYALNGWSVEHNHEFRERLEELKQYQCSPWDEIQLLELEIKHKPVPFTKNIIINGFDIGSKHTTRYLTENHNEALNGFRFLRFFEDAALPFSLPQLNIAVDGANNAIKRVATYSPNWCMNTMLRTRDKKSAEIIFTRESLYKFDSEFINTKAERYIHLLSTYSSEESSLYEYGKVLPEVLSRLCCRVSNSIKDKILDLIIQIYSSKPSRLKYQSIDKLLKRLILSFNDEEIHKRLDKFTRVAHYLVINDGNDVDQYLCANPYNYFLELDAELTATKGFTIKLSNELIKQFLDALESSNSEVRQNASLTLIRLKKLGFLNKNQEKSLLSKLLSQKDQHGLPTHTVFYKFVFLDLFDSKSDIENAFKKFMLETKPLSQANTEKPNSYSVTSSPDPFTNELIGSSEYIAWSEEELKELVGYLISWWETDKVLLENSDVSEDLKEELYARFSLFVESINASIIKNNLRQYEGNVQQIIKDFKKLHFDFLCLKAVSKDFVSFDKKQYLSELEEALSSNKKTQTLDGLWAIYRLLKTKNEDSANYETILANFIRYSRGRYLSNALQVVIGIYKNIGYEVGSNLEQACLFTLSQILEGFDELDFEENLALKQCGSELASQMSMIYLLKTDGAPQVILDWLEVTRSSNEFSEIRKPWGINKEVMKQ